MHAPVAICHACAFEQGFLDVDREPEGGKIQEASLFGVRKAQIKLATNYLGVGGQRGVLVPPREADAAALPPPGIRLVDITDGWAGTVGVVEASDELAVVWTKPGDFEPHEKDPIQGLVGVRRGVFLAMFCDGSVRDIAATINKATLRAMFTRDDGEVNLPQAIQPHKPAINLALLTERRDTLRKRAEMLRQMYKVGRESLATMTAAQNELLDAELEMEHDVAKRISLHQRRVENMRTIEKQFLARRDVGADVTPEAFLKAKAARIEAEIALLREREIAAESKK